MIEPTMKAMPPRKKSRSHTSTAARMFSAKPVSEIALGVRRDSISLLRTSSLRSPLRSVPARGGRRCVAGCGVRAAAACAVWGVPSGGR